MSDTEQRLKALEDWRATVEARIADETLLDVLRAYPKGGVPTLSAATKYARETLYRFARGQSSEDFSWKMGDTIAAAFGEHEVFGETVTADRLCRLFYKAQRRLDRLSGQ